MKQFLLLCTVLLPLFVSAQTSGIKGRITDSYGEGLSEAVVYLQSENRTTTCDSLGFFAIHGLIKGTYKILVTCPGMLPDSLVVSTSDEVLTIRLALPQSKTMLKEVQIIGQKESGSDVKRLNSVDGFGIYEGKKTEVVLPSSLTFNAATNNARQLYARVSGLHIWESDQAGLQLGIGGRGLSPNRTANFNVRQNGYDISADALGYPESYYTPPAEAIEQIEIVRGAASLQYGTQFGGMVNFKLKQGPLDKKVELQARQTVGSWGFWSTFHSIGGTIAKGRLTYYIYHLHKQGNGYRPNAMFHYHNVYTTLTYRLSEKLQLNADFTKMRYLAKQPGGLTDKLFETNARQSVRQRNWFFVDWNLAAVSATYRVQAQTQLNFRAFGLIAQRQSLGNLERINVADFNNNRTLIDGRFRNIGSELRLLHRYRIGSQTQAVLVGVRVYQGSSEARQGDGSPGNDPNFVYLNPGNLENSDYRFPNRNYAVFAEQIFQLSEKISITPGIRWEFIDTRSQGYFKTRAFDAAGNLVAEARTQESLARSRRFLIAGIGVSWKLSPTMEWYGNISQNYRAINFTDLRVVNPNFIVDQNIQDERGYTADIGLRSTKMGYVSFELTAFYLRYEGKIGQLLRADRPPLFIDYRYRGNISDARNIGLEALVELRPSQAFHWKSENEWKLFLNTSVTDARYINTQDAAIRNRLVEMVPPQLWRYGSSVKVRWFQASVQHTIVSSHFSDATNAKRTSTAVEGIIAAYYVVDVSLAGTYKAFRLEFSCNNILDKQYFTRRAESYPGPGIIPADGRGYYVTLAARF
jgi:Fe(3+) dicitrate transport protein